MEAAAASGQRWLGALLAVASLGVGCKPTDRVQRAPDGPTSPPASASVPTAAFPAVPPTASTTAALVGGPGLLDARFVGDLTRAFAEYRSWGRVDDRARWAPFDCRAPPPPTPRTSAAQEGPHARKLYSLFARDHAAYTSLGALPPRPAAGGQIVVKESYLTEPVAAPGPRRTDAAPPVAPAALPDAHDNFWPYAQRDDGSYVHATGVASVFVMIEKPKDTEGTDEGFVYGTLTSTGVVTSAGRVASCMGCHEKAKHRRWFGLSKTASADP